MPASSVAGAAIVALDGSVLTVVQPTLQRELGASPAQVQWTSSAYLVAVASLLVVGGADRGPVRTSAGVRAGHARFRGRLGRGSGWRPGSAG
ncbi:hypothetical protein ACRAWF_03760 [Streptomyces sp. L7]